MQLYNNRMLPPIKYKVHPKMAQIIEEKRKRKQILQQARYKEAEQRQLLKEDRKQYMEENKKEITRKNQLIHQKKAIQRNIVREEEKDRAARIAIKKAERLMTLVPERREVIEMLRQQYLDNIKNKDLAKQAKLQEIIENRLVKPEEGFKLQEKVRDNNLIDTNQGVCVICLTSEAHIYMNSCRHLISCKDCEFILRLQKKCPLCRKQSNYTDLKEKAKKRKSSLKK